jgi:glutaredoxin 3
MITVYTKNNCPYCVQAKTRLKQGGWDFEEINIEEDAQARDWLIAQGHRTMPQIYHNDKIFCEGCQGLFKMTDNEINEKLGLININGFQI